MCGTAIHTRRESGFVLLDICTHRRLADTFTMSATLFGAAKNAENLGFSSFRRTETCFDVPKHTLEYLILNFTGQELHSELVPTWEALPHRNYAEQFLEIRWK